MSRHPFLACKGAAIFPESDEKKEQLPLFGAVLVHDLFQVGADDVYRDALHLFGAQVVCAA